MRVVPLLLLIGLTGCAAPPGGSGAEPSSGAPAPSSAMADDELLLVLDRGNGTEPERYTVSCDGAPDGDHPDVSAACSHLAPLVEPFAALPSELACTQIYGGPETARITGRWNAADVDLEVSRTNGCLIAQWDSLGPLLPPVDGPVLD